ncbi:MAG: FG-GAP repeat protein, partial [Myxococcota bacterium]
ALPDIVVGLVNAADRERVFVYRSLAVGLAFAPVLLPAPIGGGGFFGNAVATVDVNGDGLADLVVGDPGAPGRTYLYFGSVMGVAAAPTQTLASPLTGSDPLGFGYRLAR